MALPSTTFAVPWEMSLPVRPVGRADEWWGESATKTPTMTTTTLMATTHRTVRRGCPGRLGGCGTAGFIAQPKLPERRQRPRRPARHARSAPLATPVLGNRRDDVCLPDREHEPQGHKSRRMAVTSPMVTGKADLGGSTLTLIGPGAEWTLPAVTLKATSAPTMRPGTSTVVCLAHRRRPAQPGPPFGSRSQTDVLATRGSAFGGHHAGPGHQPARDRDRRRRRRHLAGRRPTGDDKFGITPSLSRPLTDQEAWVSEVRVLNQRAEASKKRALTSERQRAPRTTRSAHSGCSET